MFREKLYLVLHDMTSRDSSVGIALGYGLDDWGSRVPFPAGATQPPIQFVPGSLSLGLKRPGREADHFHLVPRSKNEWSYTSTSPIRLRGVVISLAQGQLYLYLLHFT
jgi:hypothetical protein